MMNTLTRLLSLACVVIGLSACNNDDSQNVGQSETTIGPSEAAKGAVADGLVGAIFAEIDPLKITGAAAGFKQLGNKAPLQVEHYMGLGSNAKSLTAILAASMIEDGLFNWDSKLSELLPELASSMLPANRDITVEELLNHRSGLLALTDLDEAASFDLSILSDDPQENRLSFSKWILSQDPTSVRGEFNYSNAGYIVAGVIMEQLGGYDFNIVLQDRVLLPLGLTVQGSSPAALDPNQPYGHQGNSKETLEIVDPTDPLDELINEIFVATGTLSMNQANYGRYLQWHLKAFHGESTPLPLSYIHILQNLAEEDYASGWIRGRVKDKEVLFHSGSTSGFETLVVVELSGKRAVFAMTNTADSWTLSILNSWLLELY